MKSLFYLLIISVSLVLGKKGFGPTDQDWGYVKVRPGVQLFWWLHYTTAEVEDPISKPLIIMLQGGPGEAGSGYGNFGEVGPLNEYLEEREYAYNKIANVLFVDQPAGTGFSIVDNNTLLATNNSQVANDFLVFMKGFYKNLPKFSKTPIYIFTESYGGKMTAEIALLIYEAQKRGEISCNLKGVGLGDSWISPAETVLTWAPYLKSQGFLDEIGYQSMQEVAELTAKFVREKKYRIATELWILLETIVGIESHADYYNILTEKKLEGLKGLNKIRKLTNSLKREIDDDAIEYVMKNKVTKALGLKKKWIAENMDVFDAMRGDFMRPVTDIVEKLLNNTDLEIVIFNAQLDLITPTPGTIKWVNELKWEGTKEWNETNHTPFVANGVIQGFYKTVGRLTFFWVLRSGHMVPFDNPVAMNYILKHIGI